MERARQIRTLTMVTIGALVGGLLISAVKFWGWQLTQSQAVYSDLLESIVNIVAGIVAIFVVRFASKPADREHPYGHGKIEYFSAAFEGGLIAFAALMILMEAIPALLENRMLENLEDGAWIVFGCGLGNFLLGLGVKHMGHKVGSQPWWPTALTCSPISLRVWESQSVCFWRRGRGLRGWTR